MNVLFKNIPIGIAAHELAEFIETTFNINHVVSKKLGVKVCCIEMLERQDLFCHPVEQFCVVRISPPELAKSVIDCLDGCFINTFKITVREYFLRSTENDPRRDSIDTAKIILEQRVEDRRQRSLVYSRQV